MSGFWYNENFDSFSKVDWQFNPLINDPESIGGIESPVQIPMMFKNDFEYFKQISSKHIIKEEKDIIYRKEIWED